MQYQVDRSFQAQNVPLSAKLEQQQPQQQQPSPLGGVCILRHDQQGQPVITIDSNMLQGLGSKIRPSKSCVPDIIITSPALPVPLAIIAAEAACAAKDSSMDNPSFLQRCFSMANTFRMCCLFVPYTLATHPAVLEVACNSRFKGKIMLHYYAPQDGLTSSILQLSESLLLASSSSQQEAVMQQHLTATASTEALQDCLVGVSAIDAAMPGPEQLRSLLGLGYSSLHHLAVNCTGEDVMACIGCGEEPAQCLWWLFNGIQS